MFGVTVLPPDDYLLAFFPHFMSALSQIRTVCEFVQNCSITGNAVMDHITQAGCIVFSIQTHFLHCVPENGLHVFELVEAVVFIVKLIHDFSA